MRPMRPTVCRGACLQGTRLVSLLILGANFGVMAAFQAGRRERAQQDHGRRPDRMGQLCPDGHADGDGGDQVASVPVEDDD